MTQQFCTVPADSENSRESIVNLASILNLGLSPEPIGVPQPNLSGGLARWQVLRLQNYIEGRVDRNVSVAELGQVVHLSASYFARAFKQTFQETPHHYLLRWRISHAKHLLGSTRLPLREVALNCGFSDQAHLCKTFRKFVGETPAMWRRCRQ